MTEPDRRSYNQYCAMARSLDILGERWTLLIVRNLLLGPLRYSDLMRGLPGITTNLLAKRLRDMEESGLIEPVRGAADGAHAYRLTADGAALEPTLRHLTAWGMRRMAGPKKGELRSLEFALLALRSQYRGGVALRAELVADGVPYRVVLSKTGAEVTRGEASSPEIRIRGSEVAIARLIFAPTGAGKPAGVDIEGSATRLRDLISAFSADVIPGAAIPAALRKGVS